MNILVIDVGTSSMRGILYNERAQELKKIQIPYSPIYIDQIHVEQEVSDWTTALIRICQETAAYIAASNLSLDALALTSQRSSIIPLSSDKQPLTRAMMWQDKRTVPLCQALNSYGGIVIQKTGSRINPVYSASKMAWVKQNLPDIYGLTSKFTVIPDYLSWFMTDTLATDYTYGSRSLLMNIHTCEWDDELLELWDIPREQLCSLIPPGTAVGKISPHFADLTGLRAGLPLILAGGDQQCSALGQGVIHAGDVQITTGTGAYIIGGCSSIPDDLKGDVIVGASAIPGNYVLESSILACCSAFNWFHHNFYPGDEHFQAINEDISSSSNDDHVIALPYFQGRGTPDWNSSATASFHNITLSTSKADMARAVLEGICFEIKANIDTIKQFIPDLSNVVLSGGLTKCPALSPMLSGILGSAVKQFQNPESTALGAWMTASVSLGFAADYSKALEIARGNDPVTETKPEQAEAYAQKYSLYQELYRKLYPVETPPSI